MRHCFYLLLVFLLTACTLTKSRSCDEISAAALRSILLKETSTEQLLIWITHTYHVSPQDVRIDADQRRTFQIFVWETDDVSYTIHMRGSTPTGAMIWYNSRPLFAGQVINCLGAPERYYASYKRDVEATKLELEMLFPDQSIRAEGWKFFRWIRPIRPAIDETLPIYRLSVGKLISVEEMLGRAPRSDEAESESRKYQPWPGNWQDIVIEIDPSIHW